MKEKKIESDGCCCYYMRTMSSPGESVTGPNYCIITAIFVTAHLRKRSEAFAMCHWRRASDAVVLSLSGVRGPLSGWSLVD